MANTIAQLLVELGINTAAFKEGLDKATYQAKVFASELKAGFTGLGESVALLGDSFGNLSPAMTGAVRGVLSALEPLERSLGTLGGGLAGVGLAAAAAGIGTIGIALHASEAAEKLNNLAQATGVNASTLSVLGLVGQTAGIGMEQLAKGLEKMGKSAYAAASAAPSASNAYKTLGIEVTDTTGKMRAQEDIFTDISTKFASMQDGAQKTALAIQIFGKSGADLIPILNKGGQELGELEDHFRKLGAVMTDDVAAAGEKVHQNMELLGAGFAGVQNKILTGLTPALTALTEQMVAGLEDSQSTISGAVDGLVYLAKLVINVFQAVGTALSVLGIGVKRTFAEILLVDETFSSILSHISDLDFKGAWQAAKDGAHSAYQNIQDGARETADTVVGSYDKMKDVWTGINPHKVRKEGEGEGPPVKQVSLDFIEKTVDALQRQANKEGELAQAMGKVTSATIEAKAASEARNAIEKITEEAHQKGIDKSPEFIAALNAQVGKIKEAALWSAVFQTTIASQDAFDKFDTKIKEQIASLQGQAAAMTEAGREFAKNDATLTPLRNNVAALTEEYNKLSASPGHDPKKLAELGDLVARQTAELAAQTEQVKRLDDTWQATQLAKELEKINQQTEALDIENAALLAGNPYGKMEADLEKFIKTMQLAPAQAKALREALAGQEQSQAKSGAINEVKGVGYDPARVTQLKAERDALAGLNLPAEVYARTLAKINAEIADSEAQTGNWHAGVKAAFADFSANIQSEGQIMRQVVGTALKGISDNLAAVVSGGKAKWGDLVASMEQMLLKSAINNILNSLFKSIGTALSGSGGFLGSIGSLFSATPHALGGSMIPGEDYLVGEKGPEIMRVDKPSTMYPSGHGPSGKGPTVINQSFNFPNSDADSFRRSQRQVSSQMYQEASYAHGKHNQ